MKISVLWPSRVLLDRWTLIYHSIFATLSARLRCITKMFEGWKNLSKFSLYAWLNRGYNEGTFGKSHFSCFFLLKKQVVLYSCLPRVYYWRATLESIRWKQNRTHVSYRFCAPVPSPELVLKLKTNIFSMNSILFSVYRSTECSRFPPSKLLVKSSYDVYIFL